MKKILTIMALVLASAGINAAPRTAEQALLIAKKFVGSSTMFKGSNAAMITLAPNSSAQMAKSVNMMTSTPSYYVCNIEKGGFVVVSGDDRFKEVLGFSLDGNFKSEEQLPDGLRYWLSFLSQEMEAAVAAGYEPRGIVASPITVNSAKSVEPLITTKWNQDKPYNNEIGTNKTGCVATGTAQVMRYWKYPTRGIGSHVGAYSPNYAADFGATVYDWDNMLDTYISGWETTEELSAVATLMKHLGVATDMRWGTSQSATPNSYAAFALVKYFGYNKNLYIENRDQMSLGAWKALLIEQLQTGHPLCYSGMDTGNVGHFFVCDGYDAATGQFHFNWGWGGYCDGYYEVTALEPGTGGIGAGAGKYNSYQTIFVNVQPEETGEPHVNFVCTTLQISGTQKNKITVSLVGLSNDNTGEVKGNLGLVVYDNAGNLVKYIPSGFTLPYQGFNIGTSFQDAIPYNVSLTEIPVGKYTVAPAAKSDENENPFRIRAKYDNINYYTMEVTETGVTLSPQQQIVSLESSNIVLTSNSEGNVFQNVVASFEVTVTNTSAQDFYDEIGVKISRGRGSNAIISVPAFVAAGETKTIVVSGAIPRTLNINDGYTVQPCYGENGSFSTFGNTATVNIKDESLGIHDISTVNTSATKAYNVAGQRVSGNANGMIIKNGVKYINR